MSNNDKKCKLPCWCYILIAILAIILLISIIYGITSLTSSFEKEKSETKKESEGDNFRANDETYDFHIEKHRIDREHERLIHSSKLSHEIYKTGIIAPCVLGVVAMICGVIYCMKIRPMNSRKLPNSNGLAIEMNERIKNDPASTSTCYEIPKSKLDEFQTLVKLGFNKLDVISAIQKSKNIVEALEMLNGLNNAISVQKTDLNQHAQQNERNSKDEVFSIVV